MKILRWWGCVIRQSTLILMNLLKLVVATSYHSANTRVLGRVVACSDQQKYDFSEVPLGLPAYSPHLPIGHLSARVLLGAYSHRYVGSVRSNVHRLRDSYSPGLNLGHTLVCRYKLPLGQYTCVSLVGYS